MLQLLQNEVDVESFDDNWRSVLTDCTSTCLRGNSHKECLICDAVMIQLTHCGTSWCGVSCGVCRRVVALVSMHYAECSRTQQPCHNRDYLKDSCTSFQTVGTAALDRVRRYLQSVFLPCSDHNDDKDDYDSDSSDDSIMMPSFSSDVSVSQAPHHGSPRSEALEDDVLPTLRGRGVDSATAVLPEAITSTKLPTKPSVKSPGGALAAELSGPRVCISTQALNSAAVLRSGHIRSVPATSSLRPRGTMHYGTKTQLQQFASLWQNYADEAKLDGMPRSRELPVAGVILDDFRNVCRLHCFNTKTDFAQYRCIVTVGYTVHPHCKVLCYNMDLVTTQSKSWIGS